MRIANHTRDYSPPGRMLFAVVALCILTYSLPAYGWQLPPTTAPKVQPSTEVGPPTAAPQTQPAQSAVDATVQAITARLQQVQDDTEKTAEVKEPLIKLYQQALADFKAANESQKVRQQWQARIAAAPHSMEDAKAKRSQTTTRATISDILDYMSFDEVQKELQSLQAQLATATDARTKLAEQTVAREKRRKELPQLISDSKAVLDSLGKAPPATADDPLVKEASGWSILAARTAATEYVQTLEAEQKAYEAEAELLLLQLEIAQANEKQLQEPVRKMTEEFNRMRQDRILQVREQVRRLVSDLPVEFKPSSDELLKRIADWLTLAEKKATVKAELDNSRSTFDRWKERYAKMANRVDPKDSQELASGFNSWVGMMLRKQRSELPDPARIGSQIRYFQAEMQIAESMLFELEDLLLDTDSRLEANRIAAQESDTEKLLAERQLLDKNKEVLTAIQVDVNSYLNDLYQLADLKEQTRSLSRKYQAFIDEHVLWIRSSEQLERSDIAALIEAFRWLASYGNWKSVGQALSQDFTSEPWWYLAFGAAWLVLVFSQSRLRRAMSGLSEKSSKRNCTDFGCTARSALITIAISLPVATFFLFGYWRLSQIESGDFEFAYALGNGMLLATVVFFPLEVLRQTSRIGGLGLKHFDWSESGARILRTNIRWLIDCNLPLAVIVAIFSTHNNPRWEASLGRVAFLLQVLEF
jgi:potassium-dependent mechanosensitive channel